MLFTSPKTDTPSQNRIVFTLVEGKRDRLFSYWRTMDYACAILGVFCKPLTRQSRCTEADGSSCRIIRLLADFILARITMRTDDSSDAPKTTCPGCPDCSRVSDICHSESC